jgi:hypothetical protein
MGAMRKYEIEVKTNSSKDEVGHSYNMVILIGVYIG